MMNGVVCYTGTATGSLAYYICDDGYELNDLAMNPRECNQGGQWSGTQLECTFKEGELIRLRMYWWFIITSHHIGINSCHY